MKGQGYFVNLNSSKGCSVPSKANLSHYYKYQIEFDICKKNIIFQICPILKGQVVFFCKFEFGVIVSIKGTITILLEASNRVWTSAKISFSRLHPQRVSSQVFEFEFEKGESFFHQRNSITILLVCI
jgi:hypothetical protein